MLARRPAIHLLLILVALAALAAGAWWYTNSRESVAGLPEAPTDVSTEPGSLPEPEDGFSMDKETCEMHGGRWNECASACPPGAEACILVCVQRCEGLGGEDVTVKAFFTKATGENPLDCTEVHPVTRATRTDSLGAGNEPVYDAALRELFKGPQSGEAGFVTNMPEGAGFESLRFENGTVTVDVGDSFVGVAGSCRVGAIRAQIEATLMQFSEVKRVEIVSNGSADEVLQP